MSIDVGKIEFADINPAKYNPRHINDVDFSRLKNSLTQFGVVDPIIINLKNNNIIGGHQRYSALLDMGYTEPLNLIKLGDIGWAFPETNLKIKDEAHEKSLNIALNKISGEFDTVKLEALLVELSAELDDLEITGFSLDDLDELSRELSESIDDYEAPDLDDDYNPLGRLMNMYDSEDGETGSLKKDFIMPPFSVLSQRDGDWQNIKRQWIEEISDFAESREEAIDKNYGTSIFDPTLAEVILKWFLPNSDDISIIDPFAGDTCFGYVSSSKGYDFTGIELRKDQADYNNSRVAKFGCGNYICDDGQNVLNHIEENTQDLLFSCPPYYDLEVYSNLENDASNQESYEDFLKIIDNAFSDSIKTLKENRFAVVVCGDIRGEDGFYRGFPTDIKNIFENSGMKLYNELILVENIGTAPLRARSYFKNRKVVKTHQNVLVFYKGDISKIKEEFKLIGDT